MRVDCRTDIGAIRSSNQDACVSGIFAKDCAWAAVCDGMGGANGGNIASSLAAETIRKFIGSGYRRDMGEKDVKSLLLNAIARANAAVYDRSMERPELRGMGTTAVLLFASGGKLHVAHVGDSRAYLKNQEGLSQITMDHSYVQDLVNLGEITPEEARKHPQRNIITRVLGVYEEVQSDYACFDFAPGDKALACTDGLSGYVEDQVLESLMEEYGLDSDGLTKRLIECALDGGGADNITVAVLQNS